MACQTELRISRHGIWKSPIDHGQQFQGRLNRPLGPAVLLGLKAVHVCWQFCRGDYLGEEDEFPTGQLGSITEVQVFGQGIMVSATSGFNGLAPPEAG